MIYDRTNKSIGFWYNNINEHFNSQNVEFGSLKSFGKANTGTALRISPLVCFLLLT